ncbi:early boundary activity protein 1 [Drosophila innubila]|uniref:early boundary activity protein 1 n=1 Tax=Drosophila innubila TaxID=198719 RepID=UPI00148B9739|nr:early boundary activity protein 1 [Drosophila innubila]
MINRRQRLEFALSILPYDHKMVQFSEAQQKVEDIIARLRTDESSGHDEESDDEKARRQENKANGFAELALQQIEESDRENQMPKPQSKQKLSTLATLTLAAEKLMKSSCKQEVADFDQFDEDSDMVMDEEEALANIDRRELMENNIQALNEARLKLLQRWERSKRKALDLLTIEIEKVQNMERPQKSPHFKMFRDGTEDHNTSTPKTNEEEENEVIELDADDEEYVPYTTEKSNKRKRLQKSLVTSTPNVKRTCPNFEFDQDGKSKMITIGPNGTQISRVCLEAINWSTSGPAITRKLLCEIFDRNTLAFHTLSGKPSPAFKDCARPSKQPLDPLKVADLVYLMTNSLQMTPREVRTAITTKCADENKMLRTRLQKRPRKTM